MTAALTTNNLPADHTGFDTHIPIVGGHPFEHGQSATDTHGDDAVLIICPPTMGHTTPRAPASPGTPLSTAKTITTPRCPPPCSLSASQSDQRPPGTQDAFVGSGWHELRITAELFERAQLERIAVTNVIRTPAQGGNIDPDVFAAYADHLAVTENMARLIMKRTYKRTVPAGIREWQKQQHGIGEHLLARLLGIIGNPTIATPHYWLGTGTARTLMVEDARPRTVGQLWSYCGHGDPTRKKRKGMTADEAMAMGSPSAKMIVHLLAEACMKQKADKRYRQVYDAARLTAAAKVHSVECVRCGPSGKPAQPGSPWNPGHQHAHALRIVGKELLRDLWKAAA